MTTSHQGHEEGVGPKGESHTLELESQNPVPQNEGIQTPAFEYSPALALETNTLQAQPTITTHRASPSGMELHLQTDGNNVSAPWQPGQHTPNMEGLQSTANLPLRSGSIKSLSARSYTAGSLSPGSAMSSPSVGPLSEMTPLPSPLTFAASSGPWSRLPTSTLDLNSSRNHSITSNESSSSEAMDYQRTSVKKRKAYAGLILTAAETSNSDSSQSRNRSNSEYVPALPIPRPRQTAVSGSQRPTSSDSKPLHMHREEYLAVQRGISTSTVTRPPTPPQSTRGATDDSESGSPPTSPGNDPIRKGIQYEATTLRGKKKRRWTAVRQLGQGTFSTVMLASSAPDAYGKLESELPPASLVAVKICDHGPAGGADQERVEISLKRELDILKKIDHPSLVHLRAVNLQDSRAFLVLNYAAGGDLFELASTKLELLTPGLVRRMFAELVDATRYLHRHWIVHRDIKLENVLVNTPIPRLAHVSNWTTHPYPIITLTDLGLGRFIPQPPSSPLLITRCGSEDYAAPELLMGQEYDGRATDAWSLGVVLYAIMEGRLPFDPVPGARKQSPTSHRIARCEWQWARLGDKHGEWDEVKGEAYGKAKAVVDGLLRRARTRKGLDEIAEMDWVKGGIQVSGELRVRGEDED